jgi:beta-hydroxylase
LIFDDLKNILDSSKWSKWMEYDKLNETPIFTKMTTNEIYDKIKESEGKLNDGKASWRLFGLILNGKPIESNVNLCKNTFNLLNKIKKHKIINAGFSCFEPNVITSRHKGHNNKILRCHIPLIIPNGDTAIEINDEIIKWKNIETDEGFFIFDDTYYHQAWNYTNKNRIVLIIDIERD